MKLAWAVAMAGLAGSLVAQNPPPGGRPVPQDTMRAVEPPMGMGPADQERARMLRERIEERFGQMVQGELQLTEPQMQRLRETMRANQDRRIALNRREADLHRAIGDQMRPGQAAHEDSLNRMLNAAAQLRVQRAQADEQFVRDLGFMTPVQRARFLGMLRRFEQRMVEVRDRDRNRPGGPAIQPGDRPQRPGIQGPRRPGGAGAGTRRPRPMQ